MEMLMLSDFTSADKHQVHLTVTDTNTNLALLSFLLGLSMKGDNRHADITGNSLPERSF